MHTYVSVELCNPSGDYKSNLKSSPSSCSRIDGILNYVDVLFVICCLLYPCRQDCIVSAAGQPGRQRYSSVVLYHNNAPRWADTLRLAVPIESFGGAHVRLEFSHCSSSECRRTAIYTVWAVIER